MCHRVYVSFPLLINSFPFPPHISYGHYFVHHPITLFNFHKTETKKKLFFPLHFLKQFLLLKLLYSLKDKTNGQF